MSFSFLPRWRFNDSCDLPQASGAIHVACEHDGHMACAAAWPLAPAGNANLGQLEMGPRPLPPHG
jgi:hypothetical protein